MAYGKDKGSIMMMGHPPRATHYARRWRRLASLALIMLSVVLARPVLATETVTLYVTNPQGSVVATMTPQGQVTYTAAYRPYGKKAQGMAQPGPGYTGHVMDPASGLVYMQQRYYDPAIGRFISPDPVEPAPGNVFSIGRYTYANNNPVMNIDPTGMICFRSDGHGHCVIKPPCNASCKRERQQARENQQVRGFGGAVTVYGNGASADAQSDVLLNLEDLQCGVNAMCGYPPLAGRGKLVKGAIGLLERAPARLRAALSVTKGASRVIGLLRPDGRLIGQAGTSSAIRILQGGRAEAESLFNQLAKGGKVVKGATYKGTLVELRGGGRIGFRPTSTSGPPTIDVFVKGLGVREIKFLP